MFHTYTPYAINQFKFGLFQCIKSKSMILYNQINITQEVLENAFVVGTVVEF